MWNNYETKLELALEEASDLFKNSFASNQSVTLPATATAEAIKTKLEAEGAKVTLK